MVPRVSFVIKLAITLAIASAFLAGCDQSSSSATESETSAPSATPLSTPYPDEAAGLVSRFYRDLDNNKESDAFQLTSPWFHRVHQHDWADDYGYIADPRLQVLDVRGRVVPYTLDYVYYGNSKKSYALYWERTGAWTLVHGQDGWMLDADNWNSVHLVGINTTGTREPVTDKVYSDGRHEFEYHGATLVFKTKPGGAGWQVSLLATPSPPPQESAPNAGVAPPPPPRGSEPCEEADVQGVYDDGKILELDDGRKLSVADYDTATSMVWVAPFDGMICGDRFINKDDNEAVDLAP